MKGINIFIKIFIFLVIIAGITFGVSVIFSGLKQFCDIIITAAQCISALAIVDMVVFIYTKIFKTEKLKPMWKSCFALLIAMIAFPIIAVIFYNHSTVFTLLMYMAPLMFIFAVINLIVIVFYMIFGSEKLTIWWKLFIFLLIIIAVAITVYFILHYFGFELLATIPQIAGFISFIFAIADLCVIIFQKIFANEKMSIFMKIFLFLLIVAFIIFGVSFVFPLGGTIQSIMIIVASGVFILSVLDLFIVIFRKIFFDK